MQSEHVLFQLISVVSHMHHCEECGLDFLMIFPIGIGSCSEVPSKPSFPQAGQAPSHTRHQTTAPALTISMAPPEPDPLDQCLILRVSNLDGQSRYSLTSVKVKEIITSLNLLAVPLLTQLMIPSLLPGHITRSSSAHFPPAPQGLLPKAAP